MLYDVALHFGRGSTNPSRKVPINTGFLRPRLLGAGRLL